MDWWLELSEYIPSSWQSDYAANPDFIWEFKGASGGPASGTPPLSAQIMGDSVYISLQTGTTPSLNGVQQLLGSFPLVKGAWMDWVIKVNFSYTNGAIRIWKNGTVVVNYSGPTLYMLQPKPTRRVLSSAPASTSGSGAALPRR